ncbi:MAG: glycosyltransferase, partial [Thermodesulfobacteriota bacterium]
LLQTMRDFEFIVRDDGSTDNTLNIIKNYAKQDQRIRVLAGNHAGIANGFNEMVSQARGKFVGLMDGDDLLAPTALEETMAAFEANPDAGMVYTNYFEVSPDNRQWRQGKRCAIPYSPDRLLVDMMIFHFRMFRRSTLDRVGPFDPEFGVAWDYDYCLRVSETCPIIHLARPLYRYRVHEQNASTAFNYEQIDASRRAVEKALQRRGMDDRYELNVQIFSQFHLRKKKKNT